MKPLLLIPALLCLAAPLGLAQKIEIPKVLPNGERPWLEPSPENVQKITEAIPEKGQVEPRKPRKLLVFYRTDGYPHASIPDWNKMLELLGKKTGAFTVVLSQNYDDLSAESLQQFDAVFLNNTCRMKTPESVKAALQDFVRSGKGLAANHGGGDNWHDWPEGMEMIGAEFVCHPFGSIVMKIDDSKNPVTQVFEGKPFPHSDEIYAFKAPYSREKLRVLLSIDYEKSPSVAVAEKGLLDRAAEAEASPRDKDWVCAVREDKDYPIAWIRKWGKGRVFYCSLGHSSGVTWNPTLVRFNLAGIQYALGDLDADASPSVSAKK